MNKTIIKRFLLAGLIQIQALIPMEPESSPRVKTLVELTVPIVAQQTQVVWEGAEIFGFSDAVPKYLKALILSHLGPTEANLVKMLKTLIQLHDPNVNFKHNRFLEWFTGLEHKPLLTFLNHFSPQELDLLPSALQQLIIANDCIGNPLPALHVRPHMLLSAQANNLPSNPEQEATLMAHIATTEPPRQAISFFDMIFDVYTPNASHIQLAFKSEEDGRIIILKNDKLTVIDLEGKTHRPSLTVHGPISRIACCEQEKLLIIGLEHAEHAEKEDLSLLKIDADNNLTAWHPALILEHSEVNGTLYFTDNHQFLENHGAHGLLRWPLLTTWLDLEFPLSFFLMVRRLQHVEQVLAQPLDAQMAQILQDLLGRDYYFCPDNRLHQALMQRIRAILARLEGKKE